MEAKKDDCADQVIPPLIWDIDTESIAEHADTKQPKEWRVGRCEKTGEAVVPTAVGCIDEQKPRCKVNRNATDVNDYSRFLSMALHF